MNPTNNYSLKKAVVVSIDKGNSNLDDDIRELKDLCYTIKIDVVHVFTQNRSKPDINFYVGKGKIAEIQEYIISNFIDIVIFNGELSLIARKNLDDFLKVEILDRNEVILEIFRIHAKTSRSKIQVELAKLTYQLPRLTGKGKSLSRTGGGIGTLGPGETILEYNRRTIRKRIYILKKKLENVSKAESLSLKKAAYSAVPRISLVGYTSVGKSTLLKNLTFDNSILVSKDLFSTLSTLSRRVILPSGVYSIFSDTVGFIKDLPTSLLESFKSTLIHINYSDLILMIVDSSSDNYMEKINAVNIILKDVLEKDIPILVVFNKIDRITTQRLELLRLKYPNSYFISAISGDSIKKFLEFIESYLLKIKVFNKIQIPKEFEYKIFNSKFNGKVGFLKEKDSTYLIAKKAVISKILKLQF
jgi:GTP-binding protein HflX